MSSTPSKTAHGQQTYSPCEICQRTSHSTSSCRYKTASSCQICHRNNHSTQECFYKDEKDPSKIHKLSACPNCGKFGHSYRNCWELEENYENRPGGFPRYRPSQPPKLSGPFVLPPRPTAISVSVSVSGVQETREEDEKIEEEDDFLLLDLDEDNTFSSPSTSPKSSKPVQPISPVDKSLLDLDDEELEVLSSIPGSQERPQKTGTPSGGWLPPHLRATLLVNIYDPVKGDQKPRAPSPIEVELAEVFMSSEVGGVEERQRRVSFAPLAQQQQQRQQQQRQEHHQTEKENSNASKPVASGPDVKHLGQSAERKDNLYNQPVTPRRDVKPLRGEEKENSSRVHQKTTVLSLVEGEFRPLPSVESVVTGSSPSDVQEDHWDFRGAWTASLDYQYHISSDWSDFDQIEELEAPVTVRLRNGRSLVATHGGITRPRISVVERWRRLKLVSTLYLPEFEGKIIAVSKLLERGFEVEIMADRIDFLGDGSLKAQALRLGDRFVFTSEKELEEEKGRRMGDRLDGLGRKRRSRKEEKREKEEEEKAEVKSEGGEEE
ncbi:hypothetical protein ABW20_dc0109268 [Dactylellina cionopaga]|nr:hypothetical protein ABW20_dc0109268 [Dactylellina cionopaga]